MAAVCFIILLTYPVEQYVKQLSEKADSLTIVGKQLLSNVQYDQALQVFEQELEIRQQLADSNIFAACSVYSKIALLHNNLGIVYYHKGHYRKALQHFERALEIKIDIWGHDHLEVASSYNNLGCINIYLGNYDQGLEYLKEDLAISLKQLGPNHPNIASSYHNIGIVYLYKDDYDKAIEYYKKSLNIRLRTLGDTHYSVASSYHNIGEAYYYKENYDLSIKYYHKALKIWEKTLGLKHPDVLTCYLNIGRAYLQIGNYDKALLYFHKNLNTVLNVFGSQHPDVAKSYQEIGNLFFLKRDFAKSLEYYYNALKIFHDKFGFNHLYVAECYKKISEVYFEKGELDKALEYTDLGIKSMVIDTIEMNTHRLPFVLNLQPLATTIQLLYHKIKFMVLLGYSIEEILSILSLADILVSRFYGELVTECSKLRWISSFHEINRLAISLLSEEGIKRDNYKYMKEAFLYGERGRARLFLEQFSNSRAVLTGVLPEETFIKKEQYLAEIVRIDKMISEEVDKPKDEQNVKVFHELYEERFSYEESLSQWIRNIEETYPLYAHFRYPKPVTINEIQEVLHENESLVAYSILNEKTIIWVIRVDTFFMMEISIPESLINANVDILREKLLRLSSTFKIHAGQFYEWLFKPIEHYLDINQTIYVICDGALHLLPLELLWDQGKKEYLLERYRIVYIQSGSTLTLLRKIEKKRRNCKKLIAFGDPVYNENELIKRPMELADINDETIHFRSAYAEQGLIFKRLPQASKEISTIASIFGIKTLHPPDINVRLDAREDAVKNFNLIDYQYIHFACHGYLGEIEDDVIQPALVLSLINNTQEDGFLQMSEIFNLKLNADLVTLSACETGLGQRVKGEGILGLTRAFMCAGATSIVVSLWKVSDRSTSLLMSYFYENLKKNMNKAEALRQAKIKLIKNCGFIQPYFWAPFILVGEWQ